MHVASKAHSSSSCGPVAQAAGHEAVTESIVAVVSVAAEHTPLLSVSAVPCSVYAFNSDISCCLTGWKHLCLAVNTLLWSCRAGENPDGTVGLMGSLPESLADLKDLQLLNLETSR